MGAALGFSMFLSLTAVGIALYDRLQLMRYLHESERQIDELTKDVHEAVLIIKSNLTNYDDDE